MDFDCGTGVGFVQFCHSVSIMPTLVFEFFLVFKV